MTSKYKRIVLKLGGEALAGREGKELIDWAQQHQFSTDKVHRIVSMIEAVVIRFAQIEHWSSVFIPKRRIPRRAKQVA